MAKDPDLIDDDENPELTAEDFARAKPFKEVFPKQYAAWKKMGRPPVETPKVHIGFRLAADVADGAAETDGAGVVNSAHTPTTATPHRRPRDFALT